MVPPSLPLLRPEPSDHDAPRRPKVAQLLVGGDELGVVIEVAAEDLAAEAPIPLGEELMFVPDLVDHL